MNNVFLKSPTGEIKEVEATTAVLTPLMAHGWHQVPAPAHTATETEAPVAPEQIKETKEN